MRKSVFWLLGWMLLGCAGLGRHEKSADQIAAERALLGKKTALLERENQVLRDENLELMRSAELAKNEFDKKEAERRAESEERNAKLKTAETTIAGLNEKLAILESESGGKIKQMATLNAELQEKYNKETGELRAEIKRITVEAAAHKEEMGRAAAEKQFNHGKEVQDLKQRIAEREKEGEEFKRKLAELRDSEARLQKELADLRAQPPRTP